MKIILIPENFFPTIGGAEISVHNIAKFLSKRGHICYVMVSKNNYKKLKKNELLQSLKYNFIVISHIKLIIGRILKKIGLPFIWFFKWYVKDIQDKHNFDIWHFNLIGFKAFFILNNLKNLNVKTIGTYRGVDIQKLPDFGYGIRNDPRMEKFIIKFIHNFNILTAISNSVKEEYLKIGIQENKIVNIPNGVDLDRFKIPLKTTRPKIGLDDNKKIILTVGRNHPKKGFALIPNIIMELLEFRSDFYWLIVGSGNTKLIESAKSLGVDEYIKIHSITGGIMPGQINFPSTQLLDIYRLSDLFVFPTYIETFGNIYLEAMAAGIPIITTNAPGARDIIKNNYNGLVSKVGDVKSIASDIDVVLSNKILKDKLINNGLIEVENFSWELISKQYEDLYNKII